MPTDTQAAPLSNITLCVGWLITGLVNCVENGDALLQEVRCMSGALNLTDSAVSHTCRLQKVTLCGSQGKSLPLAVE